MGGGNYQPKLQNWGIEGLWEKYAFYVRKNEKKTLQSGLWGKLSLVLVYFVLKSVFGIQFWFPRYRNLWIKKLLKSPSSLERFYGCLDIWWDEKKFDSMEQSNYPKGNQKSADSFITSIKLDVQFYQEINHQSSEVNQVERMAKWIKDD